MNTVKQSTAPNTLPPGKADEGTGEFEQLIKGLGESRARLSRLCALLEGSAP